MTSPEAATPTTTYPPFSGDDPTCTACGFVGARTTYRGTGECIHPGTEVIHSFDANPRLCRECRRCDYRWDEATVPPAPAASPR